jgi:CRISPR-associated protein Csd1
MIKELSDFGKPICEQKYGKWNHVSLKEELVSIDLVIDANGNFCKFVPFEKKAMIAEALTSKKGKARLLLDKAEEVLCYGAKSSKKHQLFLDKLRQYDELSDLKPVLAFYGENKKDGIEKARQEFTKQIPDEKNRKGNIAFIIQGKDNRIHEEPNVRLRIIREYEKTYKADKVCSICGKADYPVEDIPHGMIKKVPDGQSSGSALVSYNEDAFESYGLEGNKNSAICANCAKTYVEGLNWLMSAGTSIRNERNKEDILYSNRWPRKRSASYAVDTAIVYWTRKNEQLDEIDYLEAPNPDDVARLIESVASGTEGDSRYLEPDQFYSCSLSGAAARITVRDWIETSLFDFRKSIAQWFEDIAIDEYNSNLKKTQIHYARLYNLARCCQRKNSDNSYDKDDTSWVRVAICLWTAALKKHTLPPLWILTKVLQRARLDGVTAERAALIKLILNRHNKGGDFVITEKIVQGNRPVAYICGQIFAKLESIQYAALRDLNAGIRERYFTYAMTSPAAAFGRLFNLNSKHFTKLKNEKPGLAITLDKELQELCGDVDINSFPANFTLEEQGQFAIGYYHQRQQQFISLRQK